MKVLQRIKKLFSKVGPGFVTGAADDDPSGIATYSIAGAQFGYALNWMSLFLIPSMIAVQEMCGRVGLATGKGLAAVLKSRIGVVWAAIAVTLLAIANIINIGADLAIMSNVISSLTRIPQTSILIVISFIIILFEITVPYRIYVRYLMGLGLLLCVYIITAFMVPQDWMGVARATFIPHFEMSQAFLLTIVGYLGTTISPYLFFWQSSEEIEEKILTHETTDFGKAPHLKIGDIPSMRRDTVIGMVFSNIITFFIVLTTASTLHAKGIFTITSAQQAAESLRPLAGDFAFLLFSIGIIGIGLQSIPVLAGSVGYAISELFGMREGLSKPFKKARGFYGVIAIATVLGALLQISGINPMTALYWAAIVNGVIAVPLILFILRVADDPQVVGQYRTPKILKIISWITAGFMGIAAALMIRSVFL